MVDKYMSVSKGCFAFANGSPISKKKKAKSVERSREPWYESYREIWTEVESSINDVNASLSIELFAEFEKFMSNVKKTSLEEYRGEIPTAILLAGINLSDHSTLFETVKDRCKKFTHHVATVWSRDARNLKYLTENVVFEFMSKAVEKKTGEAMKKIHCTFSALSAWHEDFCNKESPLIIILPDYESFSPNVLHDFILTLSSYMSSIKFTIIFGVATTLHVVHQSLTYDATANLRFQVFRTRSQEETLSDILEGTLLNPNIPFKLIGNTFSLLIDSFLCVDFSVNQFVQSYRLCMWNHFSENEWASLCCNRQKIEEKVEALSSEKLKEILKLPSMSKYLRGKKKIAEIQKLVIEKLKNFHTYSINFLTVLKGLHKLSLKTPTGRPWGKQFRELYTLAISKHDICQTVEYSKAIELLNYYPKEDLLCGLSDFLTLLKNNKSLSSVQEDLQRFTDEIKSASTEIVNPEFAEEATAQRKANQSFSRAHWSQVLRKNADKPSTSPFKEASKEFFTYLREELFPKYLQNPSKQELYEIFCYDHVMIKNILHGSQKAYVDHNLRDPGFYLKCKCCQKSSEEDSTFDKNPDLCILYKLQSEHGKMVNLYDLLQQFAVVLGEEDDEEGNVAPLIQARFDKAVMELGFLGFVKPTQKKTDHVKRLT